MFEGGFDLLIAKVENRLKAYCNDDIHFFYYVYNVVIGNKRVWNREGVNYKWVATAEWIADASPEKLEAEFLMYKFENLIDK